MDIWDRKTLKKLVTIEAPNSSECAWSPDGRFIMTATLSPRLRVDNGYKIWHYMGVLVHARNVNELLQVGWRSANVELYPMRSSLSPPPPVAKNIQELAVKSTPKGAYRPPHARGQATPDHFKREDETSLKSPIHQNGLTGVTTNAELLSKAAVKNKKRAAKKKKEENGSSSVSGGASTAKPLGTNTTLSETEKKIRNLTKKLRQIAELKERQTNGEKLEQTQIQKIATEATLLKELRQLNDTPIPAKFGN
ncbi:8207_t:CDS:2 [Ambispora gerdemannii]|uniref:8207_t:CDS:1 n=1 Tax=Ambispora gerdemannii TaxID=144530 RepID=A0A9N8ZTE9_9GLOM|nr:8207_t:CDS:2 [Ambispora gerdemannii]